MARKRPDLPNNALLRYRSFLFPSRKVEMEVLVSDPSELTGNIKVFGKDTLRLRIDNMARVWHIVDNRYGWKKNETTGKYERQCGSRAELLPLPGEIPVNASTGHDPADYNS